MADLKPIRSEADYEEALAEAERLWGTSLGTPEGDRLDILATLIDAYEAQHYPMDPPDPVSGCEAHQQCLSVASSLQADEDQSFIDAVTEWGDEYGDQSGIQTRPPRERSRSIMRTIIAPLGSKGRS